MSGINAERGAFAARLRSWRERAGLSQRELAAAAGLSVAAVRDLEQARSRSPRPRSLRALAAALHLSPQEAAELYRSAYPSRTQPSERFSDAPVRVAILGPLLAGPPGGPDRLGGGRHRLVLARLALTPAVAVSRDELVDLMWGPRVPDSAANQLQVQVSRLRRLLEPENLGRAKGVLTFGPGGYRLTLDASRLDVVAYRDLLAGDDTDPHATLDRLDQALGLWRDEALVDVPQLHTDPAVVGLTASRIDAAVQFARLAVQLSEPERALPRLRELAPLHPLHEPLQAELITVLGGCGQRAAALALYEQVRRRLVDGLGLDPGSELVAAQQALLRQGGSVVVATTSAAAAPSPAAGPAAEPAGRPYQTPAPPADFTGRKGPLAAVLAILDRDPNQPAPPQVTVCVVSGAGGVGKTSLALRAAQQLRAAYPDGQLFADLHGPGQPPAAPVDVLARFLRSLGVPGRRIPADEAESAALFRTVLAERRTLVVLDNVRSAAQVRSLIPGVGGSAVLVTSRRRLVDLAGAAAVELELPSPAEAVDMLSACVGRSATAGDPAASLDLVTACGLLPIAIRVAGARLASRPAWTIRAAVDRLADERYRLDHLRVGDIAVDACFDVSYRELSPSAARAFRLLALLPGLDFDPAAAAVLTGTTTGQLGSDLDDLVDGNLLQVGADGRYRYHDLLRLYATLRAETEDPVDERTAAIDRLLGWYLDNAVAAMDLVFPRMLRLPVSVPGHAGFASAEAARGWLDTEVTAIVAAIEQAASGAAPQRAWQLADQLRGYFFLFGDAVAWLASGRAGLAAAERGDNLHAQAAMHQTIGQAYWSANEHLTALAAYERAADLAQRAGWRVGLAYQFRSIGLVQAELGRLEEAEVAYRQALSIEETTDHVRAVTLNDLGTLCHERGDLLDAAEHFAAALRLNSDKASRPSAMSNHNNLGMVLRQLGRLDQARGHLNTALAYYREIRSPKGELSVLDELSQLHVQSGEPVEAVDTARSALDLTRQMRDTRSEAALLSTLGNALLSAGELDEAEQVLRQSLRMAVAHAHPYFEAQARTGIARVLLANAQVDEAVEEAEAAMAVAWRVGYRSLQADALLALAEAYHRAGRAAEARARYRDAVEIYRAGGLTAALTRATALGDRFGATSAHRRYRVRWEPAGSEERV